MNGTGDFENGISEFSPKKTDINNILKKNFAKNGFTVNEQENIFEKNGKTPHNLKEWKSDTNSGTLIRKIKKEDVNGINKSEIQTGIILMINLIQFCREQFNYF